MNETSRHEAEGIRTGMMVEVLNQENTLLFLGRIDEIDGDIVVVKEANDKRLPSVIFNSTIKLKSISTTGEVTLFFGKVTGNGDLLWRLERVDEKRIQDNRAAFRQRVEVETTIRRAAATGSKETWKGTLMDISTGGARLRCDAQFRVGDYLLLESVQIIPEEAPFQFTCFVRRVEHGKRHEFYGCEFGELSHQEEERLFRAIFTVQQRELRQKRSRY